MTISSYQPAAEHQVLSNKSAGSPRSRREGTIPTPGPSAAQDRVFQEFQHVKEMFMQTLNNYELVCKNPELKEILEEFCQAKMDFIKIISHEIRTPMNSILGFSKMLINEETDPHKRNKLEIILKAGNNLLTLFDEMIQFAKLELDSQPSMISSSMTKVPQSRAAPIRPLPLNSTEGFRLLIAEDNEMNQVLFQELAEELGFNCLVVENGQIALEQLRQAKYDVVLLDINMPVMDGMETIREIRHDENLKDLFVIALTGLALEDDKTICLEAGYDDYIAKPIRVEEFQAKIQQALVLQHPGMEASPLFSSLFTPPPLQVKEDEWPEIILSPDQRGIFLELIEQIRLNLKIFSPQKITALANKLEAHEELPLLGVIRKSLRNAAEEFDETILRDLIKRLERLI